MDGARLPGGPQAGERAVDEVWAASAKGKREICAPSKAHPPVVAPGVGALQALFLAWLWLQALSLSS